MPPLHHRVAHHLRHLRHRTFHHARNAFIPHEGNDYHPHLLRRKSLNITGAILIGVKVVSVVFVSIYAGQAHVTTVSSHSIILQTNATRTAHHVTAVKENTLLDRAAQAKANDMVNQGYFAHFSPTNVSPWYWFKKAGYNYAYAGENLAIDYVSSEAIITAWLNSPSHRANLLSTRYADIGVAVADGMIHGVQSQVVVQLFGSPVKPVAKPSTKPVQTPAPATVKTTLAQKPTVLGEVAPQSPPMVPTIETPQAQSLLQTGQPSVVGRAEPGSVMALLVGTTVVARGTVPSNGIYELIPQTTVADGMAIVTVTSQARGRTSTSAPVTVAIDTKAPVIDTDRVLVVPLAVPVGSVYVSAPVGSDTTQVTAASGGVIVPLQQSGDRMVGIVQLNPRGPAAGMVVLTAYDLAGNSVHALVYDAARMTTGVVAPGDGPASRALQAIFFSRAFLTTFFILIFMVGSLNVGMNWRRQHHPALLGLILLLYIAGALVVL